MASRRGSLGLGLESLRLRGTAPAAGLRWDGSGGTPLAGGGRGGKGEGWGRVGRGEEGDGGKSLLKVDPGLVNPGGFLGGGCPLLVGTFGGNTPLIVGRVY